MSAYSRKEQEESGGKYPGCNRTPKKAFHAVKMDVNSTHTGVRRGHLYIVSRHTLDWKKQQPGCRGCMKWNDKRTMCSRQLLYSSQNVLTETDIIGKSRLHLSTLEMAILVVSRKCRRSYDASAPVMYRSIKTQLLKSPFHVKRSISHCSVLCVKFTFLVGSTEWHPELSCSIVYLWWIHPFR